MIEDLTVLNYKMMYVLHHAFIIKILSTKLRTALKLLTNEVLLVTI